MVTCAYSLMLVIIKYLVEERPKLYFYFDFLELMLINETRKKKIYVKCERWMVCADINVDTIFLAHHRSTHSATHWSCHWHLRLTTGSRTFDCFVNRQDHTRCLACSRQSVDFDDRWFPDTRFEVISHSFFVDVNTEPTIAWKTKQKNGVQWS